MEGSISYLTCDKKEPRKTCIYADLPSENTTPSEIILGKIHSQNLCLSGPLLHLN